MTSYGYRVFAVELFEGKKAKAQPFGAARLQADGETGPTVDYLDCAIDDVAKNLNKNFSFGLSTESGEDEHAGELSGISARFTAASRVGNRVRFALQHGVINGDGILVDPKDVDDEGRSLRGKSTLHNYRACLLADPSSMRAIVAVEVRGRSCPIESLVKGLRHVSSVPWSVRPLGNVAGQAIMEEFIRTAKIGRVQFHKWTHTSDGTRDQREVSMSVRVSTEGEKVRQHVLGWAKEYFGFNDIAWPTKEEVLAHAKRTTQSAKGKPTRTEVAAARKELNEAVRRRLAERSQATELNEAKSMVSDIYAAAVDIDFNDVSVDLSDGDTTRTVRPSTDFRRFTYSLGKKLPTDDAFYSAAEATAASLLSQVQDLKLR
ncbi:hypothetical protein [Rhodococcus sp. NPDC060176]|uniref:hypothetical protein n=1 Tax=Rhodococcus sp. NPDC060176 TaxID=3347062 RepID=UPI00365A0A9B